MIMMALWSIANTTQEWTNWISFSILRIILSFSPFKLTSKLICELWLTIWSFWEARNVRRGGELMGIDMLLLDAQVSYLTPTFAHTELWKGQPSPLNSILPIRSSTKNLNCSETVLKLVSKLLVISLCLSIYYHCCQCLISYKKNPSGPWCYYKDELFDIFLWNCIDITIDAPDHTLVFVSKTLESTLVNVSYESLCLLIDLIRGFFLRPASRCVNLHWYEPWSKMTIYL